MVRTLGHFIADDLRSVDQLDDILPRPGPNGNTRLGDGAFSFDPDTGAGCDGAVSSGGSDWLLPLGTKLDILWVENHAEFARFAGQQFLAEHAVTVVPSLAAAHAALAKSSFDVVLIDYDLDDGKGTELMGRLWRLRHRPMLVAVSSHEEGNKALVKSGADAVCGKLQFGRIAEVIAGLAARGSSGRL